MCISLNTKYTLKVKNLKMEVKSQPVISSLFPSITNSLDVLLVDFQCGTYLLCFITWWVVDVISL